MQYRRLYLNGASYFFTLVTKDRKKIFAKENYVNLLRKVFKTTKQKYPFEIIGFVLLPDHLHCIWEMPYDDGNFSMRWRFIKSEFSRCINKDKKYKQKIWQNRYWEHCLRDEKDLKKHMDYIHYNPVKHGYVEAPRLWLYSSFQKCVQQGYYEMNWGWHLNKDYCDISPE